MIFLVTVHIGELPNDPAYDRLADALNDADLPNVLRDVAVTTLKQLLPERADFDWFRVDVEEQ